MKNPPRLRSLFLLIASLCFALTFNPVAAATFGDFTYVDNGTTITITDFDDNSSANTISIPASINGKPVTMIGQYAFDYCYEQVRATIPSSVISIGYGAFFACEIREITIPSSVTTIEDYAFSQSGLKTVIIPSSVTSIGVGVFSGTAIWDVTIPSSITSIGNYAFSGCYLTGVAFPANLKSIGISAFSGCENLSVLTIPASVTSIGSSAFSDCRELRSVTIGSSAELDGTFIGCWDLKSATFLGDAPVIMNRPFDDTASDFKIYFYDGRTGFTWPTWQGYPTSPIGPEITIQQPTGSLLLDGAAKKSFGSVTVKKSRTKIFTIKNIGTENLTGFFISKDNTHAKDFIVTKPGKTTLYPGKSTTFEVTFKPSVKGTQNAAIHIKSNDANENPFDIKLTGLGVK